MILTNGFDPDVRVYKEAKYLVSKGKKVTILCWDRKGIYPNEEIRDRINIIRFPILSKAGSGLKQIVPYIKFFIAIKKYLKTKDIDYLHCHDFDGALIGYLLKSKKYKFIFDMHEIYSHYAYAKLPFFKILFNKILKNANYIIYVNDIQKQQIEKKYYQKLIFFPNYPSKEVYLPIKKNKSNKIRINYIGSLRDYDSLYTLSLITNSNYQVGIYGTGICYDKLKENLKNSDILYGKYDGIKDSGAIYRNTDILYCVYNPSISNWKNAYPVKLYESIITLTPIIVSKNTKAASFVTKYQIGEIVKYSDEKSLLKAIINIKKNYQTYVNNINKIRNNYSLEMVIKNLDIIYK